MRHGRTLIASLAVSALLFGAFALGHGRFGAGPLGRGGPGPHAAAFDRTLAPVGRPAALLARLGIGTTATFTTFDGDPADAAALQTLSITIGQTSEAAFGRELAAALEDGAFLRVDIGESERTLEIDEDAATFGPRGRGAFGAGLGTGVHALGDGDTVRVSFYADDPETLGTPTETLTFTHGVDSLVAFTRDAHAAAAHARYAVVTTSPRTLTFDLSEAPARLAEAGPGARSGAWQDDGAPRMAQRRSMQHEGVQRADPPRTGPRR